MSIGRRAFLQRLGIGAVAAPAAAKHVVDKVAADLAGVNVTGAAGLSPSPYGSPGQSGPTTGFDPRATLRRLLANPELRDEYTSAMFARNRSVGALDLDLATKRSFSLAAKVTFQRQRNVAREIEQDAAEVPLWRKGEELLKKAAGWPFA